MITITLTLPKGLNKAEVAEYRSQVLMTMMATAQAEIARLVQQNLHSLRTSYMQGLTLSSPGEIKDSGKATIELHGALNNMVEQGASSWDLRETLLNKNPKKRTGKNGNTYAFIPFRHATPGNYGAMPEKVYEAAKELTPSLTTPGKTTNAGGKQGAGTTWGSRLKSGLAPTAKAHHTTDIYAGMYRFAKTYKSATGGQYRTFRTISSRTSTDPTKKGNLHPASWIHPGFVARNFLQQASKFVETHADGIVASIPIPSPEMGKVVIHG